MTSVTLTTSMQQILGPADPYHKRWVLIQNQGATNAVLKFDGSTTVLTSGNGFILYPAGSSGNVIALSPSGPKGTEGQSFIEAIGASGGEVLIIQTGEYDNH